MPRGHPMLRGHVMLRGQSMKAMEVRPSLCTSLCVCIALAMSACQSAGGNKSAADPPAKSPTVAIWSCRSSRATFFAASVGDLAGGSAADLLPPAD